MPAVDFCIHCLDIIKTKKEDFVVLEKEWENKPRKLAHPRCQKEYLERTEKRGNQSEFKLGHYRIVHEIRNAQIPQGARFLQLVFGGQAVTTIMVHDLTSSF